MLSERVHALKALAEPLRSILHAAPESRARATLKDSFPELQAQPCSGAYMPELQSPRLLPSADVFDCKRLPLLCLQGQLIFICISCTIITHRSVSLRHCKHIS